MPSAFQQTDETKRRDKVVIQPIANIWMILTSNRERQTAMEPKRRFSDLLNDVLSNLHVFVHVWRWGDNIKINITQQFKDVKNLVTCRTFPVALW